MVNVSRPDQGVHLIDLDFQGRSGVIASYLVEDADERVLIEIGPTSTIEMLLAGLDRVGVAPDSIAKVLVTHIHLDHAGAAGSFIHRFPQATLYVHEIGAPHLVDPSKLVASASRIYGDMMDILWGPVMPVPANKIVALTDGDIVTVGNKRLDVLYTPGHASHHVVYYDSDRGTIYAGDAAAVRMQGHRYVRPATPPPDINLEVWSDSLQCMADLPATALYLTHFGPFTDVKRHLQQTHDRLYEWADIVGRASQAGQDRPEITDNLRLHAERDLLVETTDAVVLEQYELAAPYGMSVDGLLRYLRKRSRRESSSQTAHS